MSVTDSDDVVEAAGPGEVDRRAAIKKVAAFGAAAGAVWVAPTINGMSVVPPYAAAQSGPPQPIVVDGGPATKVAGCFGGAGTNDSFHVELGDDGWWDFTFQGCGGTESVALWDPPGGPFGNAYEPPTGFQCRMELISAGISVYDTGFVSNPINGIADTGGVVFIGTAQYPNGHGNMHWRITCEPL